MMWLRSILAVLSALTVAAPLAAAPPPIEIYGRLPGLEMATLSPSGDRVAMVGVIGEERRLIILDKAQEASNIVNLGDAKVRSIDWAGEDKVLLRDSQTVALGVGFIGDKIELSNMMVVPANGGAPWTIFKDDRRIVGGVRGYYGVIERGGRWYGYFGGISLEQRGYDLSGLGSTKPELYEVDLETRKATLLARRTGDDTGYRDWLIGPDGKVAAVFDFLSNSSAWSIRNAARQVIASGKAPTGEIDLLGMGRTGGDALYYTGGEDGITRLFEIPLAGGTAVEILPDDTTSGYRFDSRSRRFIGYVRDSDRPEDRFFDPRRDKLMAAARKAFPGLTVRLKDANDAFDRLLVQTEGPRDPQTWWLVDLKTRAATDIGVGYTLAPAQVGPMRMFGYKAGDGLAIDAVLTLPPDRVARKLPVIVMPHGGPWTRDYPGFDWWAQAYASRGYAVLQPNFRGSTGYSDSFRRAGNGEWGRKMQSDISDGLAALAREGIVDPARACIVGASYGGYAALAGVTVQQGLYRCAVSVAGIGDVSRMVSDDVRESGTDATLIRALRELVGSGRDLRKISPVAFADRADAPILLIHGVDDTRVPFAQSRIMATALERAGKPFELVTLKGEDHFLSRSETRLTMLKASLAFIEKHNPPDPEPAKTQ